jgi:hypothetical protein
MKKGLTLKYLDNIRLERVKNSCSYISPPPYAFTAFCVIKQRQRERGRKIYLYLGLKRINILQKQHDRADKVHGVS